MTVDEITAFMIKSPHPLFFSFFFFWPSTKNQMPKRQPISAALKQAVSVQRLFHFGHCVTLFEPPMKFINTGGSSALHPSAPPMPGTQQVQ